MKPWEVGISSLRKMSRRLVWMSSHLVSVKFWAVNDTECCTFSWTQNASGYPHACIFTPKKPSQGCGLVALQCLHFCCLGSGTLHRSGHLGEWPIWWLNTAMPLSRLCGVCPHLQGTITCLCTQTLQRWWLHCSASVWLWSLVSDGHYISINIFASEPDTLPGLPVTAKLLSHRTNFRYLDSITLYF